MSQPKLTKSEREKMIFNHLKGIEDPLYDVSQTKYGKWIVKAKQIQLEEEEQPEQEPEEEEQEQIPQPIKKPTYDKAEAKRERRRKNRRAKQDAKRILNALTNLINSNNGSDSSDDEQQQAIRAPPLVEPNNYNPGPLTFRRNRLRF